MNKKRFILLSLMMAMLPFTSVHVNADPVEIPLQVGIDDPTLGIPDTHRGPVLVPEVAIEDYTLYFDSSCFGCTLRLVDENDNVVYTTIIIGDTLVLPSTLSGEYELQIIFDDCYFHGVVEF
jgi:hypothetical protein